MRVLDIGARDGFFTFESERRGAREVIALDNEPPDHTGFSIAARLLGSKATYITENVYSLNAGIPHHSASPTVLNSELVACSA